MIARKVLLSVSSDVEHDLVVLVAQRLRALGVDVRLDRFTPTPASGWVDWSLAQIDDVDHVVLLCSPEFRRRAEERDAGNWRFEAVLVAMAGRVGSESFATASFASGMANVPAALAGLPCYWLPRQLDALALRLGGGERSPALPPGQVFSSGSDGLRVAPLHVLQRLLLVLFPQAEDFRRWLALAPGGDRFVSGFIASATSAQALFDAIKLLDGRGELDADFFDRLIALAPKRRSQIERVAALWTSPRAPSPTSPVGPSWTRLEPFPGRWSQEQAPDLRYVELDVAGERRGDHVRLSYYFHNDAAAVEVRDTAGVIALVEQAHERGPARGGAAALALGEALTRLLFGRPGESHYHKRFRQLFREPEGALTRATLQPVRCRLHLRDPELLALPWRLLAEDGRWLADEGWRCELAAVEVARNHAQVVLAAPCPTLLVVPEAGRGEFDPTAHRDELRALLAELWCHVVDPHLIGSYVMAANTWPQVQELVRRAELVYVCARASDRGRWTLGLDQARGGHKDVPLDELLALAKDSAKLVFLDTEAPRPLAPSLVDAAGPPCVIAPWTSGRGPESQACARQFLRALLSEGHEPVSALHVVTREQASARAGTMQVITRYRGFRCEPAPRERYTGRARLHVDRRNQRLRFWDLLQGLAQHPTRRLEVVVAYGERAHGIEALPDLLDQHVEDTCNGATRAALEVVRDSLALPHPRGALDEDLHEAVCTHVRSPDTVEKALIRRFAAIDAERGARKIWWLDWGVVGADGDALRGPELLAFVRYHTQKLAPSCPRDLRIVVTLCVADCAERCRRLKDFLEHKIPDSVARTAIASVTALPELHEVERGDLIDYLERYSSCPSARIGAVANTLLSQVGRGFEALVEALEAVERRERTWEHLAGSPTGGVRPGTEEDF